MFPLYIAKRPLILIYLSFPKYSCQLVITFFADLCKLQLSFKAIFSSKLGTPQEPWKHRITKGNNLGADFIF